MRYFVVIHKIDDETTANEDGSLNGDVKWKIVGNVENEKAAEPNNEWKEDLY